MLVHGCESVWNSTWNLTRQKQEDIGYFFQNTHIHLFSSTYTTFSPKKYFIVIYVTHYYIFFLNKLIADAKKGTCAYIQSQI